MNVLYFIEIAETEKEKKTKECYVMQYVLLGENEWGKTVAEIVKQLKESSSRIKIKRIDKLNEKHVGCTCTIT